MPTPDRPLPRSVDAALVAIAFEATIVEWRGPAPYLFAPIPEEHLPEIKWAARTASYGWGCVPVEAQIGGISFRTSLFPRNDTYLLPVKTAVQRATGAGLGDTIAVSLRIGPR